MAIIVGAGNELWAGSHVTTPAQVGGMNASEVESRLEIEPGRGGWSTAFLTRLSNLQPLGATSGGAAQFRLGTNTPAATWVLTPP